jgi:hypothetical protein
VVELIPRDNDAFPFVLFLNNLNPFCDIGVLTPTSQRAWIDSNWKFIHVHKTIFELDSLCCCFHAEQAATSLKKVVAVFFRLKSDQICAQDPLEKLFANSQAPEYFGRREGHVEEEADLRIRDHLPDHLRD